MRLDDVQEHFGDQIVIEWKSFMLRSTEAGRKSRDEFIAYTRNWERMPEADPRLEVTAPWASDDEHPSHSLPALAASKLAATYGPDVEDAFHRAMFKAYFAENRTISDTDVITAIAEASGADATEFGHRYRDEQTEFADQVISDHNDAVRLGINAVPTIIVDDRISIPGAQETATYIRVIEQLLNERQESPATGSHRH